MDLNVEYIYICMTPRPTTPTTPSSSANRKHAFRLVFASVCVLRFAFCVCVLFVFEFCNRSYAFWCWSI